jgi:hypothetical protein
MRFLTWAVNRSLALTGDPRACILHPFWDVKPLCGTRSMFAEYVRGRCLFENRYHADAVERDGREGGREKGSAREVNRRVRHRHERRG